MAEKEVNRAGQLEALADAQIRLTEAKAAKKRDARLHAESLASIEEEIADIMANLAQ